MTTIHLTTEYWNIHQVVQKKKREELTLCNVIFCLLVIFIHISAEPVTLYLKDSPLYILTLSLWRLSSFVVQGFLFLSGVKLFLNRDTETFSYPKFLLGRGKRVVLPYLAAAAVFYLYFLSFNAVELSLPAILRHLFLGDLTSHFYFVIIIVQFYLLMPLWRTMAEKSSPIVVLPCALILMMILKQYLPELLSVLFGVENFDHNSRLFTSYLFYFVLGVFFGIHYDDWMKSLRKQLRAVSIAWITAALVNCVFIYWNSIGKYYAGWLDNFHILYCFLSILLCLILSEKAVRSKAYPKKLRPAVRPIDKASYYIYLIHPMFIFLTDRIMGSFGIRSISWRYGIRFAVVYALTTCVCLCFLQRRKKG